MLLGVRELWKHGLEDFVDCDFSSDELFKKLNNVSFMGFVYEFVFPISHAKQSRKEITNNDVCGVVAQLTSTDMAWAIVKYIDNE